jgi:hypothetical protein
MEEVPSFPLCRAMPVLLAFINIRFYPAKESLVNGNFFSKLQTV